MRFERMPDPFWWWHAFWHWRYQRKRSWRTRFALWPVEMKVGGYVWLEKYWIHGTYRKVPVRISKTGGPFGGPTISGGWGYWVWHKTTRKPTED